MKTAKINVRTPVGELEWVRVEGEGHCFGKDYSKEEAKYTANVILSKEVFNKKDKQYGGKSFKEVLDDFHKEHSKGKGEPCYRQHEIRIYDEDGSGDFEVEETDDFVIKAKTAAYWAKTGKKNDLPITDASGKRYPRGYFEDNPIGNGSRGRLAITVAPYDYSGNRGTTAYLNGLQLSVFKPYEGNVNFDEIEGDTDADVAVAPEENEVES